MYCTTCGKQINDKAVLCVHCGVKTTQAVSQRPIDPAVKMLLPIGRSGYAIAAGYLGIFSLIPLFAPFAILFGFLAINDIKKNPEKSGMGRAYFGIGMGIFSILIMFLFILRNVSDR